MSCVRSSPRFDDWFIILDGYDENGYNYEKKKYWDEDDHVCSLTDKRIPFHFLTTKLNDSGSFSKLLQNATKKQSPLSRHRTLIERAGDGNISKWHSNDFLKTKERYGRFEFPK